MSDLTKLLLSSAIGFFVGIFTGFLTRWPMDKLSERRAFVRSIADKYIGLAQSNSGSIEDEFYCIGTLQAIGAAELRPLEFCRVCRRIAAHGLKDPRNQKFDIFTDRRRHIRPLLRVSGRYRATSSRDRERCYSSSA